ncbi:hypothetical protein HAHI6034_11765 [Hathewaya histolytica]|uniref:Uncharacterized protein n=1 Tax=Hathewaya histolytica TaxID=1498 RepID=A0A4U9RJB6_HATHI|nr:hypothetical protein [Hathewaya histolytica]VTQ88910.1 Uncharacterised protein [Hathewaya histolytica]
MDFIKDKAVDGILFILKSLVKLFINCSYPLCLAACLLSLILYIGGLKKARKYIPISFIIYFLCESIKGVI